MLETLRSSPKKLARVFRKGRDAWKERAQQQQRRAKRLDGKVADLTRSRDRWKAQAKQLKRQLRELAAAGPAANHTAPVNATTVPTITPHAPLFCPLPNGRTFRSI